mmetsp:Transcript_9039/g.18100  ORF Transcript_9039/g.18100 Transcript_9039/m.18100 type:complete len:885 (-) Transcript_9039:2268-4922(-)
MGDTRRKRPVLAESGGAQHASHLRVRSRRRKASNHENRFSGILRNECFPALVPVLAIFGVYLFVCWIMVWVSMYRSLNDIDDDHGQQHHFNKRNDIIAMRLEQFLSGRRTAESADSQSHVQFSLSQIIDQDNAKQIQSSLLAKTGYPQLTLGAYLEPPLSIDEASGKMKARVHTAQDLTHVTYPLNEMNGACSKNGAQWILPTSHPITLDHYFGANVFRKHPMYDKRWELANGTTTGIRGACPVDADPYLPWIHDIFPSDDGSNIEFVISNKRRCNTDPNVFKLDLENLEPQVGNMQPVPVKRLKSGNLTQQSNILAGNTPRYSLATSIGEADEDGEATKFICRFHTVDTDLNPVVLGETLSKYPYNPEHLNYRKKGSRPMLTPLDKGHDEQIWNSVYQISCSVPKMIDANGLSLANVIASGQSVSMPQGIPSIYVDLIPIRTPVRKSREGFGIPGVSSSFDPNVVWGDARIIPLVENSGRWSNIPICNSPKVDEQLEVDTISTPDAPSEFNDESSGPTEKKHFLAACVWASQSFSTRGQTAMTDSSEDRLLEFLAYHTQIAGFDHVYVYDNSDTSLSNNTLAAVTDMFPKEHVSRVPWPHRVCNNNRPMHPNPGERSSQYAAEASCRARYGPDTTWMASLDADEYLIPTGMWKNLRDWLIHVTTNEKDTQILSFFQTRALPNVDAMVPYDGASIQACKTSRGDTDAILSSCLMKNSTKTYMETYNCEPTTHPKPQSWAWRAKKQIYRPAFVLNHFVHYSVATRQIIDRPDLDSLRFNERQPFERRVNETSEGYLLHSKSTLPEMTANWHSKCPLKATSGSIKDCKVGIPSSNMLGVDIVSEESEFVESDNLVSAKFESNCYPHMLVKRLVPFLEVAMKRLTSV